MLVEALSRADAIHLTPTIARLLTAGAFECRALASSTTIDLNQLAEHGVIEHDGSLSRDDTALGDNAVFSRERWEEVLPIFEGDEEGMVTRGDVVRVRYATMLRSKEEQEATGMRSHYGVKEAFLSYGEISCLLNLLGDGQKMPLDHMRILFGRSCHGGVVRLLTVHQSRVGCPLLKAGDRRIALPARGS
jgi:hypothetical protein